MHGFELQALAPVHRHEPDRVHLQRGRRDVAEVTLLVEQYQLPHSVERTADREPAPKRARVADEVEQLPYGDRSHAFGDVRASCQTPPQVSTVEQVCGESV